MQSCFGIFRLGIVDKRALVREGPEKRRLSPFVLPVSAPPEECTNRGGADADGCREIARTSAVFCVEMRVRRTTCGFRGVAAIRGSLQEALALLPNPLILP